MKIILLSLLACAFLGTAQAAERTREFAAGGIAGVATSAPWTRPAFREKANFFNPRLGVFGRYYMMAFPEAGWEFAYDRLHFGNFNLGVDSFTANLFWRVWPEKIFHPIFGIGLGLAQTQNYYASGVNRDLAIYRVRAGVEFELTPQLELAFQVDHFTLTKNKQTDTVIHALTPSVSAIYYLSAPKTPASPTPGAPVAK